MSITLTNSAIERIKEIRKKDLNHDKFLRISISGGGCSGFQYLFDLENKTEKEEVLSYEEGSDLLALTDETSLQFLDGCESEFVKELGASYFKVNNPNDKTNGGCGSSFSV